MRHDYTLGKQSRYEHFSHVYKLQQYGWIFGYLFYCDVHILRKQYFPILLPLSHYLGSMQCVPSFNLSPSPVTFKLFKKNNVVLFSAEC